MSATSRPTAVVAGDRNPADASRASFDLDIEADNGVSLTSSQSQMDYGGPSAISDYGSSIPNPFSGEEDVDLYMTSEDDVEMSSDGGLQIHSASSFSEEQLNTELDMVDAEIMGPYNLAAIATNHVFNHAFDTSDDEIEDWDPNEAEDDDGANPWSSWTNPGPSEGPHAGADPLNLPNAMSEVSQQLQHIQEGQEQGELAESAVQHGAAHDNSTEPILSDSFLNSVPTSLQLLTDHIDPMSSPGPSHQLLQLHGNDDEEAFINNTDPNNMTAANFIQVEDQHNLSLGDFLYSWGVAATRGHSKKRRRGPHLGYLNEFRESRPHEIRRSDLRGEECDFQGIDWEKLEVPRIEARRMRMATYKNYTNLNVPHWHPLTLRRGIIEDSESFFKFRRMDFKHKINLAHFQLRNLVAATNRNNLFYAGESRVYQANPRYGLRAVRMNLTNPEVQPTHSAWAGIQISTIAADHNVLIAGGFCGEYAMVALDQPELKHTEGLILDDQNSITNHIQVQLNRQSGLPQAAIASNDCGLRILDCTTDKFVAHHKFENAVNCSALSPDHRLRAVVGDTRNVMICNAETGEILQELDGHVDYGFACAWADNGWHVATGNQDKLIKIWDARMWSDSYGSGKPLRTISAVTAGVRSLKFSPLGSGKRVLIAAEPADVVSVIDAEWYMSKQVLDFYGEIAGVDFTPDGQDLFVGIHDSMRGGIMEFEKCGFGQTYGHDELYQQTTGRGYEYADDECVSESSSEEDMASGLDWKRTTDAVVADARSKGSATYRHRKPAFLHDMEPF